MKGHAGTVEDPISIPKKKCGGRSKAFDLKFGGKMDLTLSLPMHLHVISMMRKIYVTEDLKVSGGSLTATARTILSMATFMQSSMIPPNVSPKLTKQKSLTPMAITFLKSILINFRDKLVNTRNGRTCDRFVKSFAEDQQKEEAFDHKQKGFRSVPVEQIVGSVGRYHDFDNKFRLMRHMPSERFEVIKQAMKSGKRLPPVKLYQIKDEYYALDGNHRIAAAKEIGRLEIDAEIVEFIPSKDTLENIIYREKCEFNEIAKLPRPINLTEVGQYIHLVKQISKHQEFLNHETKTSVSFENAAKDWYQTIYQPLTDIINKGGLLGAFPGRTIADLYAYISTHQWDDRRSRNYGSTIDPIMTDKMEEFRKKMSNTKEIEYPEMHRGITAFILMNVKSKSEFKIMDKLYALKEVKEVHTVHGEVDLLVKVMLTRDLLSSDAETISQFVHNKVRSISGVTSTVTLIPGVSKMKEK